MMQKIQKILALSAIILAVFIAFGVSPVTAAYTIDGDLNDWGLAKLTTDPWSSEATWLPNAGIHYIIEDNKNPDFGEAPMGVHIRGTGSSYVAYHEQKVKLVSGDLRIPPVGGEDFDLEGIYLDQDSTNLYLAIVTSVDPDLTGGRRPGDIALNMDKDDSTGDLGYEYGIVTGKYPYPDSAGLNQGDIVYLPKWENKGAVDLEAAEDIVGFLPGGYVVGNLGSNFAYTAIQVSDNNKPNWVIETAIPFASIGNPLSKIALSDVFYADNCINDTFYVPEFPTIAVSAGAIFGLVFVISMIHGKREN